MKEIAEMKFSIGEIVLYRRYGVCKVTAIENRSFSETEKTYYLLEPVFTNKPTKFFVPADSEDLDLLIRSVLDKESLSAFVAEAKETSLDWVNDSKQRITAFESLLKTGSVADMVRLIRLLTYRKRNQRALGKSFLDCDRRILATAEKLVSDELAYVLGIERSEISEYLLENM